MKLHEIVLLEIREILDRSIYGQWIDSNTGKVHPVHDKFGHDVWLKEVLYPKLGVEYPRDKSVDPYKEAYKHGFVRVAHSRAEDVHVSGFLKDIKKIKRILAATAMQEDVYNVSIDYMDDSGHYESIRFMFPYERKKFIEFLQ